MGYGPVGDRDHFLGSFGGCVEVVIASVWWVHEWADMVQNEIL